MPRFVILEHDWPTRHWDLLLESVSVLKAWRILEQPVLGQTLAVEPNFDHRLMYLDFEGPLSGQRGSVQRWDWGHYQGEIEDCSRFEIQLVGEQIQAFCRIGKVAGEWKMTLTPS